MTLNRENLETLLDKLSGYVKHLRELQKYSKEDFLENWKVYDLVDRELYLAIEACINIGEILISGYDWKRPDDYKSVMKILIENRVLDNNIGERMIEMVKFRNKLAHDYLELDHELIYEYLQNNLGDFEEFMKRVGEFAGTHK